MNLPLILKRIALTQMGIADHFANHQFHDQAARLKLLEETKRINADLQAFIDSHKIEVTRRKPGVARKCRECGTWH
jgi:hypothetical protein